MPPRILVTGGAGYVATLVSAALIEATECHIVAVVRSEKSLQGLQARVRREVSAERRHEVDERFEAVCLREASVDQFAACLREHQISQIAHCAGSVDYGDVESLVSANVHLTRDWLAAAKIHGVDRFLHVSTAFSAGDNDGELVREELHFEPKRESTAYTKTKREAERLVYDSGLRFVIIRPSILVGDSRDGHYGGKAYGVHQFWTCAERFLSDRWRAHLHVVIPRQSVQILHQDHFMSAFIAIYDHAPDGSIINVVSQQDLLPNCREVWDMYAEQCLAPEVVTVYDALEEVPLLRLDPGNRAFLKSIAANIEINSLPWRFDTTHMARFRDMGIPVPKATLDSLAVCQQAFVAKSSALQHFIHHHAVRLRPHRERVSISRTV